MVTKVKGSVISSDGVGYTPAGTDAVVTDVQSKLRESVSVKDFGAVGDGDKDDRLAIQSAIDYVSSLPQGGSVYLPAGVYIVGASGSSISGRAYGVLLKSNVAMIGDNQRATVVKTKTGVDVDLITTARLTASENIAIKNITLDGNSDGTDADTVGMNLWLSDVTNLEIENVVSSYPEHWGIRIQSSTFVQLSDVTCLHDTATNADGVHFVDCSGVTATNINVYTEGDDGFVIEAINDDVRDYAISGLKVTSSNHRGVLIFSDPNIVTGSRTISNINISGAVVSDCGTQGIVLQGASFFNIQIDALIENTRDGLYLVPGTAIYPAKMSNCRFNILAKDLGNYGVIALTTYATYHGNELQAHVYNPGNNFSGIQLGGDSWSGSLFVDYNPNGDKTLFGSGVLIQGDYNDLQVTAYGAGNNLRLASTAQNNNIKIGVLKDGETNDLILNGGATGNRFSGGIIAGGINLGGNAGNSFSEVGGATFYGVKTLDFSVLGTGSVVVPHLLGTAPRFVTATIQSSAFVGHVQPISIDDTNITFSGWTTGGALVTSGAYTCNMDIRI